MKLENKLCTHYLTLGFSENFLSDTDTKVYVQLPYPIHKPLRGSTSDKIDEYIVNLENYRKRLETAYKDFPAVKNTISNQKFTESHVTITKELLNLCNNKHEAPFPCDYNPYYTTGILEHANFNGREYLLRPDYKNNLRITDLSSPWKNYKLPIEQQLEGDITGMSAYKESEMISLLLKHKNEANLLQIEDINEPAHVSLNKKFKNDILDAKIYKNKMGYVFSNGKLQIYNLKTSQKIDLSAYDIKSAVSFEFINEDSVAVLSQKNLKLIDLRSNDHKLFEPQLNTCDYLCSVKIFNELIYLGSRHHLIRTDMRISKNVEFCTHLMKHSPCYVDMIDDFLVFCGQKVDQKVLFHGNPISSLPLQVPGILDTFGKYRLEKDILLRNEIEDRLRKSVGGIKLISHDNDTYLYTVNSLGDIFKQKIAENVETSDNESKENFYKWVDYVPERPKPLRLTSVANASEARFALNKRMKHPWLTKYSAKPKKPDYFLNVFNIRYHTDNLNERLAKMVAIWDDDEEEQREVVVPEVAPLDKVSSWIEANYFD